MESVNIFGITGEHSLLHWSPSSPLPMSLQSQLFPVPGPFSCGFTTSSQVYLDGITQVPLSDTSLGVTKISSGTSHPVVPGPLTDEPSWEATYPNGSYAPSSGIRGGFGFYVAGPDFFTALLPNATEVLTSYSVLFQDDWEWQLGGKLPGQCM